MADALTVPGSFPAEAEEKKIQRQMIGFNFFKVMPEWRRLPAAERAEHKIGRAHV